MTAPKYCSQESLLRALLWLQQSPPLLSQQASLYMTKTSLPETIPLYTPDQQALEHLKTTLSDKPWLPLGIYYEHLWQFLIRHHSRLELIAHNLQVIKYYQNTHTTLGEYDLIYRFNQQLVHRELAIKFYLGVPLAKSTKSPWQHWVGPGLKDRLDRKMQRLLNHQILLSDTPEGHHALTQFGSGQVQKEILLQGRLFYPLFADCPPPVHSSHNHLRGYWLTVSEYRHWLASKPKETRCRMLEKPFWLDNDTPLNDLASADHLALLNQKKLPLMVKCQNQYLFVVPDSWPEQAIQSSKRMVQEAVPEA